MDGSVTMRAASKHSVCKQEKVKKPRGLFQRRTEMMYSVEITHCLRKLVLREVSLKKHRRNSLLKDFDAKTTGPSKLNLCLLQLLH